MKKYIMLSFFIVFLFFFFFSGQAYATLYSTFDTDTEGWTVSTGAKNLTWNSTGGNPGGFISAEEALLNDTWFFVSPVTWGGDWTSYIGGKISYDIIDIDKETWDEGGHGDFFEHPDVSIGIDDNNKMWWSSGNSPPNMTSWTNYEVQLLPSNFTVITDSGKTFQDIMANVNWLAIRGEYFRYDDKEGLDNVRVAPVPEPATMLLLGTGLIGLAGFRRKFLKWLLPN